MLIKNIKPHVSRDSVSGKPNFIGIDVPFGPADNPEIVYKFRPADPKDVDGDQVCNVDNPEHIAVFQSIPERYELLPKKEDEKKLATELKPKAQSLKDARKKADEDYQKKMNEAATERQRKAKANRGKKTPAVTIDSLDD